MEEKPFSARGLVLIARLVVLVLKKKIVVLFQL